ncbi:rho GTPase-activating protein 21 isoform X3 [Tribolium castaneum]|uniref:rho GTPase-activating protein 21 isoform X3 n=1 Tax=Tribolium castaneum TaxID=7070 RepID=UPI00046C19AB|nr:PREDICTED: rho GTPase-activating protein 21 isoform X3 [Tribolium castaneum]|eukprot:XP_008198093.1 PREDICTED: rho GTPase-activating protein 21 isoform X3 [Tribolium castaneum]
MHIGSAAANNPRQFFSDVVFRAPMADDGDASKPKTHRPQETFHRAQETQVEHKFPNPARIAAAAAAPLRRGPKKLLIKRNGDSFGFTLRHFIVYPPDSIAESDDRYAAVGALSAPMDTIFVKNVKDPSPAKRAGLQKGDRLVKVNDVLVTNKSYAQVVQLIQNTPDCLQLLVVPKEDDILQRYFAETAYNPASNQLPSRFVNDHQAAQQFLTQTISQPPEFQVDALSWRSLQSPYGYDYRQPLHERSQRSAENLDLNDRLTYQPNDPFRRQRPRAQPQVPPYRNMGRRASDGCALSDREYYSDYSDLNDMKTIHKPSYLQDNQNSEMPGLRYPNAAGCRLSLDAGRRESSSSLTSSLADGSKDSLTSFDSTSTLTGQETDDSARMSRFRKSVQQKEEFLKMPTDTSVKPREFYSRPNKLERAMWPPAEPARQESPSKTKPTHQNFQRVKNDIENERDLLQSSGGVPRNLPQQKGAKSPNDKPSMATNDRMKEASVAPSSLDNVEQLNGSFTAENSDISDDKRLYPTSLQMVHKRARQFESGKPENDPQVSDRTLYFKSEIARFSSKKIVPNVTERAQEFETRSEPTNRETPATTISPKRIQRDSRSLDSNGSTGSNTSLGETIAKRLSGNVMISTGSKYIHCPPPSEYGKPTEASENQANRICARSNSAESWVIVDSPEPSKRISRQDAIVDDGNKSKDHQVDDPGQIPYADLPPLIPEPVEHMHFTPSVSITPAPTVLVPQPSKAVRPNQLDLEGPVRPSRHLKPPSSSVDTPMRRPVSPADDERTTRRESYLKATEGGRMPFDSDMSDSDVSPQVLRSAHRRWRPPLFPGDIQQLRKLFEDAASSLGGSASGNSSSSASLDREKSNASPLDKDKHPVIREGPLHCKITEIDGKRSGDRSWKQIWAALKGPKLFLHKDKHHQSPMGTSDAVEHSLASGVDMRASEVRVADDYTKRKHVLRVSSVNPCRSEFLLQAENTEEFTDWFKALQEQMATNTEAEAKFDPSTGSKQQAVPQTIPASTSILVQGNSRLSPQPTKCKSSTSRNRSPTGQSPVSKNRKPSQVADPSTSPKVKTWRGRVAQQFRRMQGASSPSSPTAPEGSTFGIPIEQCLTSSTNPYVPRFVEVCTDIVDAHGLQTVGIYRVPGNNASIVALIDEINRNYEEVPVDDPRWNDLHVVSSLLKAFFRKIPDSLVTSALYPSFIKADKIENPEARMKELKRLIKSLPPHNYHTLKHIMFHLKKVMDNSEINKMEAKNLAIVFGPNIVRPEDDNMETMVSNMTHQYKIVETLLTSADWFFSDDDTDEVPLSAVITEAQDEPEPPSSQALLLENISKYEALKDKQKNGALLSSIISAAQRKVKRKTTKGSGSLSESKEVTSPNGTGGYYSDTFSQSDLKNSTITDDKSNVIPTTVSEIEKSCKQPAKVPWFNYSTDKEDFHRRIENFKQETEAMLQMPRHLEISVTNIASKSTSASNVNQTPRLSTRTVDSHLLKTNSASNVFTRTINMDNRHSLDNSYQVQYNKNNSDFGGSLRDTNRNESVSTQNGRLVRRGSSVENVNSSSMDLNANGAMKKVKYENEGGSLDSLHKEVSIDDDADLVTTLTNLYDKKLMEKKNSRENLLSGEDFPYADESPEKTHRIIAHSLSDKENVPNLGDCYRNPSLHKNQFSNKANFLHWDDSKLKESKNDTEKDEDSTMTSEKHISNKHMNNRKNSVPNSKLRRSESLNKPERTVSPLNNKLKRSESLNKTGDKLKRSDSLTKTEKTESNLNKRRELATSVRRSKDVTKLKRKNGMPDRSIKRRHTVGGTKDPDKVTWLDNKYQEEVTSNKENKEKNLRTSSPDLSSTRRERLFFEINLIGPENMVVALKQHLMGARPQSFPETAVFKVPLESHV